MNLHTLLTLILAATTAPDPITDLQERGSGIDAKGQTWITLGWSQPAGAFGYELRSSVTGPITTEAEWNAATGQNIDPAWPTWAVSGLEIRTIGGIIPNQPTWYAVRSFDGGFPAAVSDLSNSIEASVDTLPPSKPLALVVLSAQAGSVKLQWTAPGDDDASGTADHYDIRYSLQPIGPATFDAATPVNDGTPLPVAAPGLQTATVGVSSPGATCHFALRAVDEDGNPGEVSDDVEAFVPAGSTGISGGGGGDGGGGVCSASGGGSLLPLVALGLAMVLRIRRAAALPLIALAGLAAVNVHLIGPVIKVAQVNLGVPGTETYHNNELAYNPSNDLYLSVYTKGSLATSSMDLLANTIDPATGAVGFTITLDASDQHSQMPSVAWNPSTNRFLVAYVLKPLQPKFAGNGAGLVPGQVVIRAIVLDSVGRPVDASPSFPVDAGTATQCLHPRVACAGGDWIVAWKENVKVPNAPVVGTIMGRMIRGTSTNAAPAFGGAPFAISDGGSDQMPVVAPLGAGGEVLVAWGHPDLASPMLQGRTFRPSDGFLGPVRRYDDASVLPYDNAAPAIAANGATGEVLLAWGAGLRRVATDGTPAGPAMVLDSSDGRGAVQALAWNGLTGEYLAAWDVWVENPSGTVEIQACVSHLDPADLSVRHEKVTILSKEGWTYTVTNPDAPTISMAIRSGTPHSLIQWRPLEGNSFGMLWDVWAQRYDLSNPPADPVSLEQSHVDALNAGLFSPASAGSLHAALTRRMSFRAGPMSDPDLGNLLHLEVELTSAAGTSTFIQSPALPAGGIGLVTTDPLPNGDYQWRARVVDHTGSASAWIAFNAGGSGPDFTLDIPNQAPPSPSGAGQFLVDGTTPLGLGAETVQGAVVLRAALGADPDGDLLRLEVEVRPVGVPFSGVATAVSGYSAPGGRSVTVPIAPGSSFHWQAWSRDNSGSTSSSAINAPVSAAVPFGGNGDPAGVDFSRAPNQAPLAPVLASGSDPVGQFESDGRTTISVGAPTQEPTLVFRGRVDDPDGDACALQVEIKAVDVAFDGSVSLTGTVVTSGGFSVAAMPGLPPGRYHWRACAIDAYGLASASFTAFGANGDAAPADADFEVVAPPLPPPPPPPPQAIGSEGKKSCGFCAGGDAGMALLALGILLGRRR